MWTVLIIPIFTGLFSGLVAAEPPMREPPLPSQAATSQPRQEVELADPMLAATETARHQLKYLVNCALPDSVVLFSVQGHERFTFPGHLGLAPEWLKAPLTPLQERWVSACMLALTNYAGKHVQVSMHAKSGATPFLAQTNEETRAYSLAEGGFFGNLFSPHPVGYVCSGARTKVEAQDPVFHDRLCTKASGEITSDGKPLTVCQFILTGPCSDPASFTVNGHTYEEVIFVSLKPTK
ncbi:hypothetical protein [Nitrospira sp. BLG_1]|uniref:hypothetical protein n=1 Tax=Nitrospira sp. BLG_1 TaxID=3395883 RepID=UPI0039BCC1CB